MLPLSFLIHILLVALECEGHLFSSCPSSMQSWVVARRIPMEGQSPYLQPCSVVFFWNSELCWEEFDSLSFDSTVVLLISPLSPVSPVFALERKLLWNRWKD